MRKKPAPPRTIETLDQILAAFVEFRVGLERTIKDPKELEDALRASDEVARNLTGLRDHHFRANKAVAKYIRAQRRKAKAESETHAAGCAVGATEALKILEG